MKISGSLPTRIAQAYQTAQLQPKSPLASISPTKSIGETPGVKSVSEIKSLHQAQRPSSINKLIGGTVSQPISFDGASSDTTTAATSNLGGPLQLYNRAADKVEAATRLGIGRAIDIKG